ncbi:DotA/TraY family protein [Epibacterium sp. SM1969]|uniref:DotA/TraY family protein n=2 Tax=Tritonibacter aquimaris TaxID=2663379 RepID=A0A844B198_9RHOB|nr:DotA/TraY family protein [Tritonibacter aquimaris]
MGTEGTFKEKGLMNKATAQAVWRYATRPEIIPRLRALGYHFGYFAYFLALVLRSARLLPANHPALMSQNIGRFGVKRLLAEAASHLKWSWAHLDQIMIFCAVVAGIVMIFVQLLIIAAMAVLDVRPAMASGGYFSTPSDNVSTDVVFIFLEQVFGPNLGVFEAASQPMGTPVYTALQAMLGFYSAATMVIAVIIVIYFVMTVVGEAAKTGTPFGRRFHSLWAPVRLVIALGLLVPLGSGLNSAQYLTLWVAKMGSGLGTQAWTTFVGSVTAGQNIVNKPAGESTSALVQRIFLNEVCAAAYNQAVASDTQEVKILQVTGRRTSVAPNFDNPSAMINAAWNAKDAVVLSWSRNPAGKKATDHTCGRISVSTTEFDVFADGTSVTLEEERWWWNLPLVGKDIEQRLGTVHQQIKEVYLKEIKRISDAVKPAAEAIAAYNIPVRKQPGYGDESTLEFIPELLKEVSEQTHENINLEILASYDSIAQAEYAKSDGYDVMVDRGWGAAGLWYGTLGTINQRYMDAVASAIPTLDILFQATDVESNERGALGKFFGVSRYRLPGQITGKIEETITHAANDFSGAIVDSVPEHSPLYKDARLEEANAAGETGWLSKTLIALVGSKHIYQLKDNPTLDPMVRLAAAGHGMLNRSFALLGLGTALSVGGAVSGSVAGALPATSGPAKAGVAFVGDLAAAAASLVFALAAIAMVAGIFLAYILPIIPFVYFAFAVMGWVLEIFEAIVAMPLWALAHLRIEEGGMPGPAALGGYQLLLMILLRPALIIFGLIGGYILFGAAVYFFSTLFNAATAITQSDIANNSIGAFGVFVYTIVYVFLVYNIALMCFKMIDDVPKGMLRWLGAGVSPFSDSRGDPINGSREVVAAGVVAGNQILGGIRGTASGGHKAFGENKRRKGNLAAGRDMNDDGPQRVRIE